MGAADIHTRPTAWLGPFISAYLRVHQRGADAEARARGWLDALHAWLEERSADHIPETVAAPRRGDSAARRSVAEPESRPAQASVLAAAELLRAWIEDLDRSAAPATMV